MIGGLPKKLNIGGIDWAIRTDFRVALLIFQALNDLELKQHEKSIVMIQCLFENYEQLSQEYYSDALMEAVWFLDGGKQQSNNKSDKRFQKKLMDWEQDEQILFSALNKVAGFEIREREYMHWWTLLGYFNEIGEGLFSTILSIRSKKANRKKLEKHEIEFYQNNKELIDFKKKYSVEELEYRERLNQMLNS